MLISFVADGITPVAVMLKAGDWIPLEHDAEQWSIIDTAIKTGREKDLLAALLPTIKSATGLIHVARPFGWSITKWSTNEAFRIWEFKRGIHFTGHLRDDDRKMVAALHRWDPAFVVHINGQRGHLEEYYGLIVE